MTTTAKAIRPEHDEIKALIAFYEARGWDWLMAVAFLSARAVGIWPPPAARTTTRRRG